MTFLDQFKKSSIKEYLKVFLDIIFLLIYIIYASFECLYYFIVPPPLKSLVGEVILITGSANGIGREICMKLKDLGATLVCWDIQKDENENFVKNLKCLETNAFAYEVDIGDRLKVEATALRVKNDVGNVTMIINNAGIMPCHKFLSHKPQEIERTFKVNVLGQLWILREFLPGMLERNHGHIVTVCSAAGIIPTPNLVPYCGTKHAVNGYINSLKTELRISQPKSNINFTTIYPFSCQTDLTKNIQCNTRFPSIYPILKPETVAEKLVDGIRRNYEYIYVPWPTKIAGILTAVLPAKLQAATGDFFGCNVVPQE